MIDQHTNASLALNDLHTPNAPAAPPPHCPNSQQPTANSPVPNSPDTPATLYDVNIMVQAIIDDVDAREARYRAEIDDLKAELANLRALVADPCQQPPITSPLVAGGR